MKHTQSSYIIYAYRNYFRFVQGTNLSTNILEKCKTFLHKESTAPSFLRSTRKDKKKVGGKNVDGECLKHPKIN